jgi:hypothetical protein
MELPLQRRKSSTLSRGPVGSPRHSVPGPQVSPARQSPRDSMFAGIMKKKLTASFAEQLVSERRVFGRMDPSRKVLEDVEGKGGEVEVRRSCRLASRGM